MAVKKRICYKKWVKCYNPSTKKKRIFEGRIRVEKYLEKNGGKTNKWDMRTAQ